MVRAAPSPEQNFLSSVLLPLISLSLIPVSLAAIATCIVNDKVRAVWRGHEAAIQTRSTSGEERGCVIVSGGRMSKGLHLARAFKRAGWKVIGVDEQGWGELCPMRFSRAVDHFYILPPAATAYDRYSEKLLSIAQFHSATLFIPVSGAVSSVEDARAAESMYALTKGKCRTFIQDPETMLDLHDKDRFMALVERLGFTIPQGRMLESVDEAIAFLREEKTPTEPKYILKCMGIDENRGDMTLFPLKGDNEKFSKTRAELEGLSLAISKERPYVFQEFIPGQEWCTHASVIDGNITSFVTCPSNDMLMTYENYTSDVMGERAEKWTRDCLERLTRDPTASGKTRGLTGHFSFDFILSTKNGELYPLECNARVHTAVILLPISEIASCYAPQSVGRGTLRPPSNTVPRTWIYNDLIMRYLPRIIPSRHILGLVHPSLPACVLDQRSIDVIKPDEQPLRLRLESTLVADDWLPFLVLWHVWWPWLLVSRWCKGKRWTRLNVSTGRIFEA